MSEERSYSLLVASLNWLRNDFGGSLSVDGELLLVIISEEIATVRMLL
jgi:hypothetical protein